MGRLAQLRNGLGFACLAAALVLSLPGISVVRAEQPVDVTLDVSVDSELASGDPVACEAPPVASAPPRQRVVEIPAPENPHRVEGVISLNGSGYNY